LGLVSCNDRKETSQLNLTGGTQASPLQELPSTFDSAVRVGRLVANLQYLFVDSQMAKEHGSVWSMLF